MWGVALAVVCTRAAFRQRVFGTLRVCLYLGLVSGVLALATARRVKLSLAGSRTHLTVRALVGLKFSTTASTYWLRTAHA